MCSLTSRTMSLSAATVKHPTKTASLETAKTVPELGEGGGGGMGMHQKVHCGKLNKERRKLSCKVGSPDKTHPNNVFAGNNQLFNKLDN